MKVSSWGLLSNEEHEAYDLARGGDLEKQLRLPKLKIAYGMGRSYGDICLNPNELLFKTTSLDRFIQFDETAGILVCESGVILRDIQQLLIPRGWMLPVTPGTQLITVGGAIANDIHGKNHHVLGSFGDHVQSLSLVKSTGECIECSPDENTELFSATIGGMGLTGLIVQVRLKLRRVAGPWLNTETIPYGNLDEFFELADSSEKQWEHTVSWVDCLSGETARGIFFRSNLADISDSSPAKKNALTIPFTPPISLVNQFSLKPFNSVYFNSKSRTRGIHTSDYESVLHPLDNLNGWNRMYGPKGFYQYQSVLPRSAGLDGTREMLKAIKDSGEGSFLTVLKTFGNRSAPGMMSFPREGVTLALDFPNRGERTLKLFDRLDAIVGGAGGRLYLSKDARMPKALFEAGYPRLNEFLKYRDPGFSSAMSRRLIGS